MRQQRLCITEGHPVVCRPRPDSVCRLFFVIGASVAHREQPLVSQLSGQVSRSTSLRLLRLLMYFAFATGLSRTQLSFTQHHSRRLCCVSQRDEQLRKLELVNALLLHDNMLLHSSFASLIDGRPTVLAGFYEADLISWTLSNLRLYRRYHSLPHRLVSPWLRSEKYRHCWLQFILYPFGTKQGLRRPGGKNAQLCGVTKCRSTVLVR